MNTTIKLRPWSGLDNTTHINTSYRIATNENMTNVVDELLHSTTNLNIYNSNVTIPLNTTYYVSIMRQVRTTGGTIINTDWTTPYPIRNYPSTTGVVLNNDIIVETPFVYVNRDELTNTSLTTFTIKSSSFRSNVEGHSATHYFIYDTIGNLLYSKMNETVNLTSLVVNKNSVDLVSKSELVFKVIHVTPTNIESPVGSITVPVLDNNLNIISSLSNVLPYTDYTLKFSKINTNKLLDVVSIDILSIDEKKNYWTATVTPNTYSYVLPYGVFGANSKYILRIRTRVNGVVIDTKKIINTIETLGSQRKQLDYIYTNKVIHDRDILGPSLSDDSSYTMLNNSKVIAKDPNTKYFYLWDVNVLEYTLSNKTLISGLTALKTGDTDVYIDIRDNGTILIDCLSASNVPTFLIYKYDSFRNTAALLATIPRPAETKCIGYNNGVVHDLENIYYYIPVGKNYINTLNLSNNTITKLYNINSTNTHNVLTRVENGKLAIITGDADVLSYDLVTNEVYNVLTLPVAYRNRSLRVVPLINNDLFIYIKNASASDTEFMLTYESSNGMLRTVTKEYANEGVSLTSTLLLSNGELLLISNSGSTDKYFIYL